MKTGVVSASSKLLVIREMKYTYENVWRDYGVEFKSLGRDEQQYILFDVLKRSSLFIPKEIEESTAKDDIQVQIKPIVEVNYYRTLVGEKFKYPMTFTLVGYDTELTGVKAVLYNPINITEHGVFFIVDNTTWEFSQEEKDAVPKRKEYQRDALADYSWLPQKLKKKGYKKLLSTIKILYNDRGEPAIAYNGKNGPTFVDYLENVFPNTKKIKQP